LPIWALSNNYDYGLDECLRVVDLLEADALILSQSLKHST